jgi:signal transduction histidine kinase
MNATQLGATSLPLETKPGEAQLKPGLIAGIALYLVFAAVVARTLTVEANRPLIPRYLGLELVFLILYTAVIFIPGLPRCLLHLYLVFQSCLVLFILSLRPEFDFVVLLFLMLGYPATLFLTGRVRWAWIMITIALTCGSLMFYLGILRGLALSLTTMAAEIVLPAYLLVHYETECARARSQVLLSELEETNQQLRAYASQVEELASMQERNRLARELHDTVSQLIFSIHLTARSAQLLLQKDPARLPEQLNLLQETTGEALRQLRSLISQLRPPQES